MEKKNRDLFLFLEQEESSDSVDQKLENLIIRHHNKNKLYDVVITILTNLILIVKSSVLHTFSLLQTLITKEASKLSKSLHPVLGIIKIFLPIYTDLNLSLLQKHILHQQTYYHYKSASNTH
jgi:hypothetical protein